MQKDIRLDHVLEGRAEGRHQHGRQIRDEADGIRQNGLLAMRQLDGTGCGVEGREQHVLGQNIGLVMRLNRVDLPALV